MFLNGIMLVSTPDFQTLSFCRGQRPAAYSSTCPPCRHCLHAACRADEPTAGREFLAEVETRGACIAGAAVRRRAPAKLHRRSPVRWRATPVWRKIMSSDNLRIEIMRFTAELRDQRRTTAGWTAATPASTAT